MDSDKSVESSVVLGTTVGVTLSKVIDLAKCKVQLAYLESLQDDDYEYDDDEYYEMEEEVEETLDEPDDNPPEGPIQQNQLCHLRILPFRSEQHQQQQK